jgi:hypothetical protein
MKASDQITCEAFARAISRLGRPAADLQALVLPLLHQIESPQFSTTSEVIAANIRALVEEYPELDEVYQSERQALQKQYRQSDRAKSITLSLENPASVHQHIVPFVQQAIASLTNPHDNTESNRAIPPRTPDIWEGVDRVLVMASGGAILGAMFARIPGAVVGGILAGLYGWTIKDADQSKLTAAQLDILRTIDKRPHTTNELQSIMRVTTPLGQFQTLMQVLWSQGYIDTIGGSLRHKLFSASKKRSPHLPDPDISLTLTTKGHFSVHPIFRFGSQKAMFR